MPGAFRWLLAFVLVACLEGVDGVDVFKSTFLYDWGFYGLFPQTSYRSFKGTTPLLNFIQWDESCDDGGYYFLSPRGTKVSRPGPVIFDAKGSLVWADDRFGTVTDFKVQSYKGKQYLTFWSGTDGVKYRYGRGTYYMLDDTYEVFRSIQPVGQGLMGDLHDLKITDEGTAMFTVYLNAPADLSSVGGPTNGWILDSMFQEVDIESGALLFEWRASEHVALEDSMVNFDLEGRAAGQDPESAFDFFHINSVDKDWDGNYVISARHMHSILCINSTNPDDILWVLGGKKNDFQDQSLGRATDFSWQHHARMHDNQTMTVFDNAKSESIEYLGEYSRGLLLQLDTTARTVKLLHEYADPRHHYRAKSQGSIQLIDDGKVLLGYGFLPSLTEFAPDGRLLCDIHLAPWIISSFGMVTSYRAFKSKGWVGKPKTTPSTYFRPSEKTLYVSWLGATEVEQWVLQGADWEGVRQGHYIDLDQKDKEQFETSLSIDDMMPEYLRVAALDITGRVLGHSEVVSRSKGNAPSPWLRDIMVTLGACLAVVATVVFFYRKRFWKLLKRIRRTGLPQGTRWWKRKDLSSAHELQPLYQD